MAAARRAAARARAVMAERLAVVAETAVETAVAGDSAGMVEVLVAKVAGWVVARDRRRSLRRTRGGNCIACRTTRRSRRCHHCRSRSLSTGCAGSGRALRIREARGRVSVSLRREVWRACKRVSHHEVRCRSRHRVVEEEEEEALVVAVMKAPEVTRATAAVVERLVVVREPPRWRWSWRWCRRWPLLARRTRAAWKRQSAGGAPASEKLDPPASADQL